VDRGAPPHLAFDEKQAAVGHHDPVADRQAQARAAAEGAEEGVEDLGQGLGGDAAAVVGEGEVPAAAPLQDFFGRREHHAGGLDILQGPDGVLEQVLGHLAQEIGVAMPGRPVRDLVVPGDGLGQGGTAQGLLPEGPQVHLADLGVQVPAEGQRVAHDAVEAAHALLHFAGEFQGAGLLLQILHQHAREEGQAAQGVADLVGQFRGHAAHGGKAVLPGGLLGLEDGFRHIPQRDDRAPVGRGAALLFEDQLPALGGLEAALPAGAAGLPGSWALEEATVQTLGPVGEAQRAVLTQHPDGEGDGLQHRLQFALELPELGLKGLVAGLEVLRSRGEGLEGFQQLPRIGMHGAAHGVGSGGSDHSRWSWA
jgi:hypothetical protein